MNSLGGVQMEAEAVQTVNYATGFPYSAKNISWIRLFLDGVALVSRWLHIYYTQLP
jgi:hypothetical protein